MKLPTYLHGEPVLAWSSAGLLLIAGVTVLDLWTGPSFLLDFLFLGPIALTTWKAGFRSGLLVSIASAFFWFSAQQAGQSLDASLNPVLYGNALTRLALFAGAASLLPSLKREWEREREAGQHDYLTDTLSRRGFLAKASQEIDRATRYQRPFTLIGLDVDGFRRMNERMGHNSADTLLRTMARLLRKKIRSADQIGRTGSDEFALLLPETQAEAARIVAQRLQRYLLDLAEKKEWPVAFSLGTITYLQTKEHAETMMKRVNALTQAAHQDGRNQIRYEVVGSVGVP
jgi:diguanylate cyclase (GGDEF)-like protein